MDAFVITVDARLTDDRLIGVLRKVIVDNKSAFFGDITSISITHMDSDDIASIILKEVIKPVSQKENSENDSKKSLQYYCESLCNTILTYTGAIDDGFFGRLVKTLEDHPDLEKTVAEFCRSRETITENQVFARINCPKLRKQLRSALKVIEIKKQWIDENTKG